MFVFPFIFFIFYTLFVHYLRMNLAGRQDVPFVVMGHIYSLTGFMPFGMSNNK